jgi:hypothetical protein
LRLAKRSNCARRGLIDWKAARLLEKRPAAVFRTVGLGAPLRFHRQKAWFLPAAPAVRTQVRQLLGGGGTLLLRLPKGRVSAVLAQKPEVGTTLDDGSSLEHYNLVGMNHS